ncbi:MAG: hypothetical protein U0795_21355 [Pirellulales bacterium]
MDTDLRSPRVWVLSAVVLAAVSLSAAICPREARAGIPAECNPACSTSTDRPAVRRHSSTNSNIAVRLEDTWYEVNTRRIPYRGSSDIHAAAIRTIQPGASVLGSRPDGTTVEQLQSELVQRPTCVYVHGYNNDELDARRAAVEVYQRMIGCGVQGPMNFIAWSWPSDRDEFILRDAPKKGCRADFESELFGDFLRLDTAGQALGIISYSLGARVVSGGLQHRSLEGSAHAGSLEHARVILLAGAIDRRWLSPSGRYSLATQSVDEFVNMINHRDPVLKKYHLVARDRSAEAAGTYGIHVPAYASDTVHQWDISSQVGTTHKLVKYLDSPLVRSKMRSLLQPPVVPADAAVSPLKTEQAAHAPELKDPRADRLPELTPHSG